MKLAKLTTKLNSSHPFKTILERAWLARALIAAIPEEMRNEPISLRGLATINLRLAEYLLSNPYVSEDTRKRLETIVERGEAIWKLPPLEGETPYHKSVVASSLPSDLKEQYYDKSLYYDYVLTHHPIVFTSAVC